MCNLPDINLSQDFRLIQTDDTDSLHPISLIPPVFIRRNANILNEYYSLYPLSLPF